MNDEIIKYIPQVAETENLPPVKIPGIKIQQDAALAYIVDDQGNRISEGYHEFKVFKHEDDDATVIGLVGVVGANVYALRPVYEGTVIINWEQTTSGAHELNFRQDLGGVFTETVGSVIYVLNDQGETGTRGYHEVYYENGILYGKIGTSLYKINVINGTDERVEKQLI